MKAHLGNILRVFLIIFLGCLIFWIFIWIDEKYLHLKFRAFISSGFLLLYSFIITWFLFKKKTPKILGLTVTNVNKKVIRKAIFCGLILGFSSSLLLIFIFPNSESPFTVKKVSYFFILITLLAPITEELFFRGFAQGLLQNAFNIQNAKKLRKEHYLIYNSGMGEIPRL